MFELLFGIFWLLITMSVSIPLLFFLPDYTKFPWIIFSIIFFGIFYAIGIIMTVIGLKKVLKNRKTENQGIETFGRIASISRTGMYVNGTPELKASVVTYVPSENIAKTFSEKIGLDPSKYKIGDYLRLKIFKDDINIISKVNDEQVSLREKEIIDKEFPYNSKAGEVVVDGVKYINADTLPEFGKDPFENNNEDW